MDEGEPTGVTPTQQGQTHANRPERTENEDRQGPETVRKNRERLQSEG